MIKRIYVEVDDLSPLIKWLKTKPSGQLKILVGGSENATPELMKAITKEGRSFGQWLVARMLTKELEIHSLKEKETGMEIGLVVESED